jgi:hypothetical protein
MAANIGFNGLGLIFEITDKDKCFHGSRKKVDELIFELG